MKIIKKKLEIKKVYPPKAKVFQSTKLILMKIIKNMKLSQRKYSEAFLLLSTFVTFSTY